MDELSHWPRDRALPDAGPLRSLTPSSVQLRLSRIRPNRLPSTGVLVLRYIVPGSLAVESSRIESSFKLTWGA